MSVLLSIDDLHVAFPLPSGDDRAVIRGLTLRIQRGEFVGLVGESGCGKTLTALSVVGLLPGEARVRSGRIRLDEIDLLRRDHEVLRRVRGRRIGMVFQDPMTALNPVLTVGHQIAGVVRAHLQTGRRETHAMVLRLLRLVAMPAPEQRARAYPHQLSGGQLQRAMLALALAAGPELLIADEPTTALDVTVQAQILELLDELRERLRLAVLLITHDLAVVAERCDRVGVMYAGQIVETGSVGELFANPGHPYTRALLRSLPRLGDGVAGESLPTIPGRVPKFGNLPSGCSFHPRCNDAWERCTDEEPRLLLGESGRRVRCFLAEDAQAENQA